MGSAGRASSRFDRRGAPAAAAASLLLLLPLGAACAFDFDGYDPRGQPQVSCQPGAEVSCYDGPAGTEGVGVCRGGTAVCNATGDGLGPCQAQVMPAAERCETAADEDCDGTTLDADAGCLCAPSAEVSCYDGPDGTEGVGACRAGSAICEPSGTGASACLGQVQPTLEECGTVVDDDCDGATNDHCGSWSIVTGNSSDQFVWGAALDGAGGLLLGGELGGNMDLGGGTMISAGNLDGWVAKLGAADGSFKWSRVLGGSAQQGIYGVAVDGAGDVVAGGGFDNSIDLGGSVGVVASTGGWDAVVIKLAGSSGASLWAQVASGTGNAWVESVATDAQGDVVAVGSFDGTVTFAGTDYPATSGTDGFIAKLDGTTGAPAWAVAFGNTDLDEAYDVAVDAAGDVYVVGTFDDPQDIAGLHVIDLHYNDGFIVKLDGGSGAGLWVRTFKSNGWAQADDVAVDGSGQVLVAGTFEQDVDWGGGAMASGGSKDTFLVALDASDGTPAWGRTWGDSASQEAYDVTVGPGDTVLLAIGLEGSVSFAGQTVYSVGRDDMFVGALDAGGNELWARRFGDSDDHDSRVVRAGSDGAVYLAGDCGGHIDFGDGMHSAGDSDDACVARLAP